MRASDELKARAATMSKPGASNYVKDTTERKRQMERVLRRLEFYARHPRYDQEIFFGTCAECDREIKKYGEPVADGERCPRCQSPGLSKLNKKLNDWAFGK